MRKIAALAIVCFWAIMMGLLLRRELFPDLPEYMDAGYSHLAHAEGPLRYKMGIYYAQGQRLGAVDATVQRTEEGQIDYQCRIRFEKIDNPLPQLRLLSEAKIDIVAQASPTAGPLYFEAVVQPMDVKIRAFPRDDSIWVYFRQGESEPSNVVLPMPKRRALTSGIGPLTEIPPLGKRDVGRKWRLKFISPFSGRADDLIITVVRRARVRIGDREDDAYLLHLTLGKMLLKAWVDSKGEVLIQETPFLVTLRREDPEVEILDEAPDD